MRASLNNCWHANGRRPTEGGADAEATDEVVLPWTTGRSGRRPADPVLPVRCGGGDGRSTEVSRSHLAPAIAFQMQNPALS